MTTYLELHQQMARIPFPEKITVTIRFRDGSERTATIAFPSLAACSNQTIDGLGEASVAYEAGKIAKTACRKRASEMCEERVKV